MHKQAAQGDAPNTLPSNANASDRAKYNAWRSKSGIAQQEAMRLYCLEADRQVRVYGFSSSSSGSNGGGSTAASAYAALGQSPTTNGGHALLNNSHVNANSSQQQQQQQSRGLAAIPLLCAAASESRQAYLRRLAQTPASHAWWKRQEPLVATPGTIWALPEHLLLSAAALVEYISLVIQQDTHDNNNNNNNTNDSSSGNTVLGILPVAVVQSFLWPTHNSLLAMWMGLILISTAWISVMELVQTLLLGSRRTGYSLPAVWKDQVVLAAQSARTLVESHQPLSSRLIGLLLLPLHVLVQGASIVSNSGSSSSSTAAAAAATTSSSSPLWSCVLYCAAMLVTWWYWFLVVPTILFWWMVAAFFVAGQCFALIELAGV